MSEPDRSPYSILLRKRAGAALTQAEIAVVVKGACDGSWDDAQLAAFLMAGAIQGFDSAEIRHLTREMFLSGEAWDVGSQVPRTIDKHSTGGVGDKVSMLVTPLLAACGWRPAKLTARGLGHTGGTADKLECIPGLDLEMSRDRCVELLESCGMAIGVPTLAIAPADRRLYALRDVTATVDNLGYVVSSILSKKLALGAETLVFDVKVGNGAVFADAEAARALADLLVETAEDLGRGAVAVLTDMNQPLGCWAGHNSEVREVVDCLRSGAGDHRLLDVVFRIAEEATRAAGEPLAREELERALTGGGAYDAFRRWATAQGASPQWLDDPRLPLAAIEIVAAAPRDGVVAAVETRELGMLLLEAGGGRRSAESEVDRGVALRYGVEIGEDVEEGQEMARLYVAEERLDLAERLTRCFTVADEGSAPTLIHDVVTS